jgi:hypothetical protein
VFSSANRIQEDSIMRILLTIVVALLMSVTSALAQQGQHMAVASDILKRVEPPTFPGAKLAIVQGDPGTEAPLQSFLHRDGREIRSGFRQGTADRRPLLRSADASALRVGRG